MRWSKRGRRSACIRRSNCSTIYRRISLASFLTAANAANPAAASSRSAGRITWRKAKGSWSTWRLRAHLIGGCMGCAPVAAFAVAHPDMVASLVLYWPVGGTKYRISSHQRFADHIAFVRENGLDQVVALVRAEGKPFGADPRGGPWAAVIKRDADFAAAYARQDRQRYIATCASMRDALFDRDTAPGAAPEQLMRVAIPAFICRVTMPRMPPRQRAIWKSACRNLTIGTLPSRRRPKRRPIRACSNFCVACGYDEPMREMRVRPGCRRVRHRRGPDHRAAADRGRAPRGSAAVRLRFAGRASE